MLLRTSPMCRVTGLRIRNWETFVLDKINHHTKTVTNVTYAYHNFTKHVIKLFIDKTCDGPASRNGKRERGRQMNVMHFSTYKIQSTRTLGNSESFGFIFN